MSPTRGFVASMDGLILTGAAISGLGWAAHLASIVTALVRVHRHPKLLNIDRLPGVSVIRPLCGIENFIDETLESSFNLRHSSYELVFCVAQHGDPVIAVVERLIAKYPHVDARILVGNDPISENPKLNNMAKGWLTARHDWVVMADSNVLMPPDYLAKLLERWDFRTGLVCSPPIGSRPGNLWAELECGFLNSYQARWQAFADSLGFGFAQGKTMCWRRELLDRNGGIAALGAELAEDAAATKLVHAEGLRVGLVHDMFEQPLGKRTLAEVWQRQLRWARLRRNTFKLCFVPELLTGSFPPLISLAAIAVRMDVSVGATVLCASTIWYGTEAALAFRAGWHLSWRSPLIWLLRDSLLPALWVAAWLGSGFTWRGNDMRLAQRSAS